MPTPQLIDERDEDDAVVPEGHELGTLDDLDNTDKPDAPEPDVSLTADVDDTIPEKYRGKSPAELAEMLVEAERFQGRQSQEVGQLRRDLDAVIQAQLATAQPAPAPAASEEEPADFFEDPEKAVDRRIDNHPAIKAAREEAANLQRQTSQTRLKNAHPDVDVILKDPGFAEWVQKSPVRVKLLQDAHFKYDFDAADELLSTWKERKTLADTANSVQAETAKRNLSAAKTGDTTSSSSGVPKKVYRRADIVRLMQTDPDRYQQLAPEIERAYLEKRVV